jgi:hypothetical protein
VLALLKELAVVAGRAAVDQVVKQVGKLLRREQRESEPSQPLTYRDVEHIRAQERSSIEASKRKPVAPR